MSTTVNLPIVLPTTTAGVLELLSAMRLALEEDIPKHRKAYKRNDSHPAVADKIDAKTAIARLIEELTQRNRARWERHAVAEADALDRRTR